MRNFKQTAAMQAGVDAARGDVIVTLDGDLQNDPADIPRLVARLLNEDLDCVAGWRQDRQDHLLRTIPSQIANALIARVVGVRLNDYGCSLKAFRGRRAEEHPPLRRDASLHPGVARDRDDAAAHRRGAGHAPRRASTACRSTASRARSASCST